MLLQISLRKLFVFVNCFVRETMCNGERPGCLCSARNLKSRLVSLETLLWRFLTVFLDFVAAFSNHLMRKDALATIWRPMFISFVFKRLNWRMVFLKTDAKYFVLHFSDSNTSWWPIREKWISFASRLQRKVRLVNSFCRCFPQNGKRVGGEGGRVRLNQDFTRQFFSFFPGPRIQTSYWLFFSCA